MDKIRMHGPFLLHMDVMVVNHESKQSGKITLSFPPFRFMTIDQQQNFLNRFIEEILPTQLPEGFSVMNKQEAWDHHCEATFHERFVLPGTEDWDQWDDDLDGKEVELKRS